MALPIGKKSFVDPVCGTTVDANLAAAQTCYNGVQIYFCAEGCRKAFEIEPQKYTVSQRKGFWRRYLDRLKKATDGRPPACH